MKSVHSAAALNQRLGARLRRIYRIPVKVIKIAVSSTPCIGVQYLSEYSKWKTWTSIEE